MTDGVDHWHCVVCDEIGWDGTSGFERHAASAQHIDAGWRHLFLCAKEAAVRLRAYEHKYKNGEHVSLDRCEVDAPCKRTRST